MALVLDGNGSMTVGNGDITGLAVGALPTNVIGTGAVLQVVTVTKTDTTSFAGVGTWWNISGLSASITPVSSSSKILVMCVTMVSTTSNYNGFNFAMARNGTRTPIGNSSGSSKVSAFYGTDDAFGYNANADQAIIMYVDSPGTTSTVSYQLQGQNGRDNETIYINRQALDGDNSQTSRGVSTLTLLEIA